MRTSSGYFFAGSKPGGRATKLWRRRPRAFTNQNSSSGAQSRAAARAVLKRVIGSCFRAARSMRTISDGLVADPQLAIRYGAPASSGARRPEYAPRDASAGATSPPRAGTEKTFTKPESSAVR
jgi:hypothetical protein